eukprot:1181305-Prorocentrum_minimum.AAC.2
MSSTWQPQSTWGYLRKGGGLLNSDLNRFNASPNIPALPASKVFLRWVENNSLEKSSYDVSNGAYYTTYSYWPTLPASDWSVVRIYLCFLRLIGPRSPCRTRQTLFFTATWPKAVQRIAGDILKSPVQINIGASGDQLIANKDVTQGVNSPGGGASSPVGGANSTVGGANSPGGGANSPGGGANSPGGGANSPVVNGALFRPYFVSPCYTEPLFSKLAAGEFDPPQFGGYGPRMSVSSPTPRGYQSREGRENIPAGGTSHVRGENIGSSTEACSS